ncbi:hypothetical protein NHX12_025051, partial [Muraenolepis orangiensis]
MEQFNPGLRNLVTLGKNYEKSVTAMALSGRIYFDAVSKIGENATISPVSRELGMVLMEIGETHKKVQMELEESATFKRYQSEHKVKQDSLDRSQTELKKLRRKSQGKSSTKELKYNIRENEYLETISSRQTDIQKFMAEGCKEALLEEKRRFCFLVDKHCMFSHHITSFHDKAKELLAVKLPSWQEKCSDATRVPDTVMTMITPLPSTLETYNNRKNVEAKVPPPAPHVKAQISPLVNMFNQEPQSPLMSPSSDNKSDQGSLGEGGSLSSSQSSGPDVGPRMRVRTIFPHRAGNNPTLLSFDEGDLITLLLQEERDGWLYGEVETTKQQGWFPSSYYYSDDAPSMAGSAPSMAGSAPSPHSTVV